ncbi:MAG TPA: DNA alkylation repair protein [Gemmataceae bacterium]|nr:DNA alkylation repair protein [Gemmataceae bacterium]
MAEAKEIVIKTVEDEITSRLARLTSRRAADLRSLRREYSKRLAKAPAKAVIELALRLLDRPGFQHRFLSYELVAHHRGALGSLRARLLSRFGRGIASWEAVDSYACYLAGPAWRERQVPDRLIRRWAASADRWWRRAALVSTVPLNNKARGGQGDTQRTLDICRILVRDRDDMVVKSLSWALRELAKRDAGAASAFLAEHRVSLASRVLREVGNKLATGLKNPRGSSQAQSVLR